MNKDLNLVFEVNYLDDDFYPCFMTFPTMEAAVDFAASLEIEGQNQTRPCVQRVVQEDLKAAFDQKVKEAVEKKRIEQR